MPNRIKSVISLAMVLNLGYFMIEFAVALAIHSVALFADSIDFLEDGMVNMLILLALGWSLRRRSRVGVALAVILMLPSLATLWTAWRQAHLHAAPSPIPITLTGAGALLVNFSCAMMLSRYRHHAGSLTKAAFLSARNDVLANIAIITAGVITIAYPSIWPDLLVGLGIAAMNADAAREVWTAARGEHRAAKP